jgi:hypothetical protein
MGKGRKNSKKASAKKANGEGGMGHNIRITKKVAKEFSDRFNNIQREKADEAEKFKADIDVLIQDAADSMGCSKAVVRQGFREQWAELKREEREKAMDPERLQSLDKLRDALGLFADSPLGAAAVAKAEKSVDAAMDHKAAG